MSGYLIGRVKIPHVFVVGGLFVQKNYNLMGYGWETPNGDYK